MLGIRRMKTLQTFASVHGSVHNPFNQERHLINRKYCKERRSAALAEWRVVMRYPPRGLASLRPSGGELPLD